jgi:hypothetical protein
VGVSIAVAVVAAVLGILILRDVGGGGSSAPVPTTTATTLPDTSTTSSTTTTSLPRTGFKVVVANASGVTGTAAKLTTQLQGEGFIVEKATNATGGQRLDRTKVLYVTGFEQAAQAVSAVLGGAPVEPAPLPVPVQDPTEATVIVMLGLDLAGKDLPGGTGGTTTTLAADVGTTDSTAATETTAGG